MTLGYHSLGQGDVKVLFLHGWLSDHLVFETLFPLVDQERYTAVFADYRGYGRSRQLVGNHSISETAEDIVELAKHLGWSRCHIVGHSMGGMVLQKVACLAPDLVASGIAITPVPASGLPLPDELAAVFRAATEDDAALTGLFSDLTGGRYTPAFSRYMTGRTRAATSREPLMGCMNAWSTTDFGYEVAGIKSKILVVAGEHDGAVGPDFLSKTCLKQLPNAELVTIESAGHYPTQETPLELFTIMEKHLTAN